mgnify:FL=1
MENITQDTVFKKLLRLNRLPDSLDQLSPEKLDVLKKSKKLTEFKKLILSQSLDKEKIWLNLTRFSPDEIKDIRLLIVEYLGDVLDSDDNDVFKVGKTVDDFTIFHFGNKFAYLSSLSTNRKWSSDTMIPEDKKEITFEQFKKSIKSWKDSK